MEDMLGGTTKLAPVPADAGSEVREDRYPDGVVFRVWTMFVRAIIYGGGLGVLAVAVVAALSIVLEGWNQNLVAAPTIMFFAGLVGAVVGTVAATGALVAILIFAAFGRGQAEGRAVVAGVGAAVFVCLGWIVFARSSWVTTNLAMVVVPAVLGAVVAGALAWFSVRRWERARSQ